MKNLKANLLRTLSLLAVLCCGISASAQSWLENCKWEVSMSGGLNTDGWEYSFGGTYFPIPYLGFKLALGVDGEIREFANWYWGDWYDDDYYYYYDEDDDDYCTRFQCIASVELRTPPIIKVGEYSCLQLFASPGVIMSPRASGSDSKSWAFWSAKAGIMATFDNYTVQLGYGYSNFNLYDGNPYSHNSYNRDDHHYTHSGFLTIGYRF